MHRTASVTTIYLNFRGVGFSRGAAKGSLATCGMCSQPYTEWISLPASVVWKDRKKGGWVSEHPPLMRFGKIEGRGAEGAAFHRTLGRFHPQRVQLDIPTGQASPQSPPTTRDRLPQDGGENSTPTQPARHSPGQAQTQGTTFHRGGGDRRAPNHFHSQRV